MSKWHFIFENVSKLLAGKIITNSSNVFTEDTKATCIVLHIQLIVYLTVSYVRDKEK